MIFELENHSCGDLTCPALLPTNVPLSQERLNGGKREGLPDSGAVTPKILRLAKGTQRQSLLLAKGNGPQSNHRYVTV